MSTSSSVYRRLVGLELTRLVTSSTTRRPIISWQSGCPSCRHLQEDRCFRSINCRQYKSVLCHCPSLSAYLLHLRRPAPARVFAHPSSHSRLNTVQLRITIITARFAIILSQSTVRCKYEYCLAILSAQSINGNSIR